MSEPTIDAAGANQNPSTAQAPAESTPVVAVAAKAARKPVKRSAEPQAAKPAQPSRAAAPAAKPSKAARPAAEPVKSAKAAKVAKPVKPAKPVQPAALADVVQPKPKLVRDSFTIPELEYAQLEALKRRALVLAHHAKKSELLRAGIATLAAMDDAQLLAALQSVPPLKTGRPKKPKADKAAVKTRNGGKKG